jgi:hypothetical protein
MRREWGRKEEWQLVSHVVQRQWLMISPASLNELLQLELPGAWEPSDRSGPLPDGEGKAPKYGFLNGD